VQQRLLALLLGLRRVRQRLPADPEGAAALLDENVEDLTTAVEELREIAHGIHPTVLTRTGLADERPGGGLEGLRDRLAALGGRLEVRAAPGQGTTVTATAPAAVAVTSA
jgi:signal transduction histidine kinase